MKTILALAVAASVASLGSAFAPPALTKCQVQRGSALHLLSPAENKMLFDKATDCLEECSLEEVDELVDVLHTQQKELSIRLQEVKAMIAALEEVNTKDERKVDQVRETVRAIFRIFQLGDKASGNDYPALTKPSGYSGEVGKGSKTAYDVLNPKKWTP